MAVIAQPHRPEDGRPPVILLVFANDRFADGAGYLRNLPAERRAIQDVMSPAVRDDFCNLVIEQNVTHDRLYDLFDAYDGRIVGVHFAGHADPDGLKLEDAYGRPVASQMSGLAVRLSNLPLLRWVFLNGCGTSAHVAALHARVKLPIIATETAIRDDIAVQFARRFYSGMAHGQTIGESFENAESEMLSQHDRPSNTVRRERPSTERYFTEITHSSANFRMLRPAGQALAWPWVMALPPDLHGTEQFQLIRSPQTSTMVPATPGATLTGGPNSVPPESLGSTVELRDDVTRSFPPVEPPTIERPPSLPPHDPTTAGRRAPHPPARDSTPGFDLESTLVTGPDTLSLHTHDFIAPPTIQEEDDEAVDEPGGGGLLPGPTDPSAEPPRSTPSEPSTRTDAAHPPYAPTQTITRIEGDPVTERSTARRRRLFLALAAGMASALLVVLGGLGMRLYDDLKRVERPTQVDGRGAPLMDGGVVPADGEARVDRGAPPDAAATPDGARTPDAAPNPDAAPPSGAATRVDADSKAARLTARTATRDIGALRADVERQVSRCSCIAARKGAAELRAAGQPVPAGVQTYCALPAKGQAAGRCAATLERKLDRALDACRCDGESQRLVTQLKHHFGIDRSKSRHDRCFVPGLPKTCISPR